MLVYRVLILCGFVSAPEIGAEKAESSRMLKALSMLFALLAYWVTCVIPVTFMLSMSWSCESDARRVGSRAMQYYGNEAIRDKRGLRLGHLEARDPGHKHRTVIRVVFLVLSLAISLGLVGVAVRDPAGHSDIYVPAAFVGLMLVVALSLRAART